MNNSDTAFREKFIQLMETRGKMPQEQLTSEDEFDNMVGVGEATE